MSISRELTYCGARGFGDGLRGALGRPRDALDHVLVFTQLRFALVRRRHPNAYRLWEKRKKKHMKIT